MPIYLIRHCEWFERPVELRFLGQYPKKPTKGLTRFGKKQAKYLGKWLATQKITTLYTSNLLRSRQTAEIISKKTKIKPIVVPTLQEIKKSSSEKEWQFWQFYKKHRYEDLDYKVEDGESVNMLIKRAKKAIREIVNQEKEGKIAIVTHAEFIKCLLASMSLKKYLQEEAGIHFASVTTLEYQKGEFSLISFASSRPLLLLYPEIILRKFFFRLMISKIKY